MVSLVGKLLLALPAYSVRRSSTRGDCFATYDGQTLLRLSACTQDEAVSMQEAVFGKCTELSDDGLALPPSGCTTEDAICGPAVAEDLTKQFGDGLVHIISADAGAFLRNASGATKRAGREALSRLSDDTFFTNWRGLDDQVIKLQSAVDASDGVAKLENLGSSVEGRPMWAVRLTGKGYAMGSAKAYFTFHLGAREWLSGMTGVYAAVKMIERAQADPSWLAGKEVVLVPIGNPDGFSRSETRERYWRKNRAPRPSGSQQCDGVDLNRNWPVGYGGASSSNKSCSDVYRGESAMDQPETKALAKVINEAPLSVHVDVRAFGKKFLTPWRHTYKTHPRSKEIEDLSGTMSAAIKERVGNDYPAGNDIAFNSGGEIVDYSTDRGALGFVQLLPPARADLLGFSPGPTLILPTCKDTLAGLYAAVDWM